MFAFLVQVSTALLALQALGTSAHYLPPHIKPRDVNPYLMKAHGTGYKFLASSSGMSSLTIEGDDVVYTVDIVLGGHPVTVQLDTGSTDLWVLAPKGSIKTTGVTDIQAPLSYGTGNLTGPILFADFQLGPYRIPNQAFVNATETASFDALFSRNIFGILGLGFVQPSPNATPSTINSKLQKAGGSRTLGESAIGNIYLQNLSLPNFFDIHIGRSSDLKDVSEGLFSIGEHVPSFEAVSTRPKLPRVSEGRWGVPLDGFQLNGQTVPFEKKSVVPAAPNGTLVAVLDSGATQAQVPPNLVDAIYNNISGAIFDKFSNQWLVPCDGTTNVTVIMGGEAIPIHPLDLSRPTVVALPLNGTTTNVTICLNSWIPFSLPPSFTGLDVLLGDAFMRNVYASYDFGDQGTEDNSFIQLLPTTNAATALSEFTQLRTEALKSLPPAYAPADLLRWVAAGNATGPTGTNATSTVMDTAGTVTSTATGTATGTATDTATGTAAGNATGTATGAAQTTAAGNGAGRLGFVFLRGCSIAIFCMFAGTFVL